MVTAQISCTTDAVATPADGWQTSLEAIDSLRSVDVQLLKQAAADASDELSEKRRAFETVAAKLRQAEQQQIAIDGQLSEVFRLAALVRRAIDTDADFNVIHGDDGEQAIRHVKELQSFVD